MQIKTLLKAIALATVVTAPVATFAAEACDRACLEGMVDKYLDAVIDANPKAVSIAPNARFTEDGQRLAIGDGLWNTMKAKGKYRLFVTDVPAGQVAFVGTIEEDNRDPAKSTAALIALRLKVENKTITQIEQMVVRNEDQAKKVEAMGQPRPGLVSAVPANKRMSRADLIAVSNKYFTGMQQNDGKGDYPFADDCDRIENGGKSTNAPVPAGQTRSDPKTASTYSGQWSCMEQFKSGLIHFVHRIRDRRFVAVDEERGVTFAFGFFDHPGGATRNFETPDGRKVSNGPVQPWTWEIAEIFKVYDGKIHEIEAILQRSPYGMNSGWSTWEQGMSDKVRDATRE